MSIRWSAVFIAVTLACVGGSIPRTSASATDAPAGPQPSVPAHAAPTAPTIVPNDNRAAAGTRHGATVDVALDATTGRWAPDGPGKPTAIVDAFAEPGRAPRIPGPLVRVTVGTDIRIHVRNALVGHALYVHNLVDLRSRADKPLVVAPREERIVRMHTYAPGTYLYWAATSEKPIGKHAGADSMLSGAIVVDPPGAKTANDRVFVINIAPSPTPDEPVYPA